MIVLFSVAFFGQQSWSTLVMILPTDLFPKHALGTVAGFVGLGGALGGVVLGQLAGYLLDHGFSYTPVLDHRRLAARRGVPGDPGDRGEPAAVVDA